MENRSRNLTLGIPTYNRYDRLEQCLESVLKSNLIPDCVHIIDNNDLGLNLKSFKPVTKLLKKFKRSYISSFYETTPEWSGLSIRQHTNIGVSRAWNYIVSQHKEDLVVISNDDICVLEDTLTYLVTAANEMPEKYMFALGGGEGGVDAQNAYSFFLIKPEMFDLIGPFDANFSYAYFEDSDHHHRARLLGIEHVKIPGARANHAESSTLNSPLPEGRLAHHHNHFRSMHEMFFRKWGQESSVDENRFEEPFDGKEPWKPSNSNNVGGYSLWGTTPEAETVCISELASSDEGG